MALQAIGELRSLAEIAYILAQRVKPELSELLLKNANCPVCLFDDDSVHWRCFSAEVHTCKSYPELEKILIDRELNRYVSVIQKTARTGLFYDSDWYDQLTSRIQFILSDELL